MGSVHQVGTEAYLCQCFVHREQVVLFGTVTAGLVLSNAA